MRRLSLAAEEARAAAREGVLAQSARLASAEDRYLTAATRNGKKRPRNARRSGLSLVSDGDGDHSPTD